MCKTLSHSVNIFNLLYKYFRWFDRFLTLCIIVNAINLAFNDYSWRRVPGGKEETGGFKYYLAKAITWIFIIECVIKIIAYGFIFE